MQQQEGVLQELEVLKGRFTELMENATKTYLSVIEGNTEDKAVEAVMRQFMNEEVRDEYCRFFEEISNVHSILSPDLFLESCIEDVRTLARVHGILEEAY